VFFAFFVEFRYGSAAMRCPFCDADKDSLKVIDSRACDGGRAIRRRRECLACSKRFTTYEKIEEPVRVRVVKKDGRRLPWDRSKIIRGLERACFKRAVAQEQLLRLAEEVEEEIFRTHDREVLSSLVGQLVTERLRRVDQVAYVRFASVYRQFKTLEELVDEAKAVLEAHRYDDPDQGKLFTDASVEKSGSSNGEAAHEPRGASVRLSRSARKAVAEIAGSTKIY
jgi:transcriptional repressor NrdR